MVRRAQGWQRWWRLMGGLGRWCAGLPLVFLLVTSAWAETPERLPGKLQVMLFKKILLYDRALQGKKELQIAVVPSAESADLVAQFKEAGFSARLLEGSVSEGALAGVDVLYLVEPSAPTAELARKVRVLTITGNSGLVEKGEASVAVRKGKDSKPEIVINRGNVKREGHELAADLLGLAVVVD